MRGFAIVFLIVGVVITLLAIGLATANAAMSPPSPKPMLWVEQVTMTAARLFGTLIAVVAGLGLLVRGLHGDKIEANLGLVAALFAGVLILSAHWAAAMALGVVAAAALCRQICFKRSPTDVSQTEPLPPLERNQP